MDSTKNGDEKIPGVAFSDDRPELEKRIEELLFIIGGAEVALSHAGKDESTFIRAIRTAQRKSEQKLKRLLNGFPETSED